MATRTSAASSAADRGSTASTSSGSARSADLAAALAGAVAAAAGIAVAELIAGIISGAPSLVIALGDLAIRLQPAGAKDVIVGLFGTNDKLALNVGIVLVAILAAAGIGVLARRHWDAALGALAVVTGVFVVAALSEPLTTFLFAVLGPLAAFGVTMYVLRGLLGFLPPLPATAGLEDDVDAAAAVS